MNQMMNATEAIPVLPVTRVEEKSIALAHFMSRAPVRMSNRRCVQLPADRTCPRSFGNWFNSLTSSLMTAYVLHARVLVTSAMDCNSLLRFKLADHALTPSPEPSPRHIVELSASDVCDHLTSPSFALSSDECLSLPEGEHGQEIPWCLSRRVQAGSTAGEAHPVGATSAAALFALGPHAAYGAAFDAAFALPNETVPVWHDDEIRISVHVRHFNVEQTGVEPLRAFEDAIREATRAAKRCAVLLATDRRKTFELMRATSARVGCRLLRSARSAQEVRDFSVEHGTDTGAVLLHDVFLLAHGHVLIGTWGSTLTIAIQEVIAARSIAGGGTPRHLPTVTYCEVDSLAACMPPLPLLTNEANHWFVKIGHSGAARIFSAGMMAKAISSKEWLKRDERLRSANVVPAQLGAATCTMPTLVRKERRARRAICEAGQTFGCFDDGVRMWVSAGCGGIFQCGLAKIMCTSARVSGTERTNCTCDKSAANWPPHNEVVTSLDHLELPALSHPAATAGAWLAAIISGSAAGLRYNMVARMVTLCGFRPQHVPAAMPSHFASLGEMMLELFGDAKRRATKMTPFELGLLISHKRALAVIARSGYAWGGVFEDDAYLHTAVPPTTATHLIRSAFSAAGESALVYLGACAPACRASNGTTSGGLPPGLLTGGRCSGYCTHAYALSKRQAATFFDDIFDCRDGLERCGIECKHRPCFADWAFFRHFTRGRGQAWIVGGGLRSPWAVDHRGIFVQNRGIGNNVSGTSLARAFRWPTEGAREAADTQRCKDIGGADAVATTMARAPPTPPMPLPRILITARWSGRTGNLLFEWASLVGVAARLRAIVPASEAIALDVPSTTTVPAAELFRQFPLISTNTLRDLNVNLANTTRRKGDGAFVRSHKHEMRSCKACYFALREVRANAHEELALRALDEWAASPPAHCEVGLVELIGYFQSHRYFDDVADSLIRPALAAPAISTERTARSELALARRSLSLPRGKLIGVQVRLGDKLRGVYKGIYAPVSWEFYWNAMRHLAKALGKGRPGSVSFIVTAGGSLNGNSKDLAEAKRHLSEVAPGRVFFSTADDLFVDLAILRSCDGLVIGGSSLGWWAAYLSELGAGKIIVPRDIFHARLPLDHALVKGFDRDDYYPPGWVQLPNEGNGTSVARMQEEVRRETELAALLAKTQKAQERIIASSERFIVRRPSFALTAPRHSRWALDDDGQPEQLKRARLASNGNSNGKRTSNSFWSALRRALAMSLAGTLAIGMAAVALSNYVRQRDY